jgi:hypothetical protein
LNIVRPFQVAAAATTRQPGTAGLLSLLSMSAFYHKPPSNIRIKIRPSGIPNSHRMIGIG